MCHSTESPPAARRDPTRLVTCRRIMLAASGGARFATIAAQPLHQPKVGVIALPDNRRLGCFYAAAAEHLAQRGYSALAIDYSGRTAGLEPRDERFPYMEHLFRLTRSGVEADVAAAVATCDPRPVGRAEHSSPWVSASADDRSSWRRRWATAWLA